MKASRRMFTAVLCALALSATPVFLSASPASASHFAEVTLVAHHSGKCADVLDASQDSGARLSQQTCNEIRPSQKWTFTRLDNGYYKIQPSHSHLCLDVSYLDQNQEHNAVQRTCVDGQPSQQWRLAQRPNGNFLLITRHSAQCLHVDAGSQDDRAEIDLETCDTNRPYQEWYLS